MRFLSKAISNITGYLSTLPLLWKLSLAVTMLIFIMMILINVLLLTHQKNSLRHELERNQILTIKKLAKDATDALIFLDPLRLDYLLQNMSITFGSINASISDVNDRIVAHTDRSMLGGTIPANIKKLKEEALKLKGELTNFKTDDNIIEILVPVMAEDYYIGTVYVSFSRFINEQAIEESLKNTKKYIFLITAVVFLFGITGAFILARLLTNPLSKLKDKMELIQSGNLEAEVPNPNLIYCSDMMLCSKVQCPAYNKTRCWTYTNTLCPNCDTGDVFEKMRVCKQCEVFKLSCGDEIGEVIEVFNHMVINLRNSLSKLQKANQEKIRLEKISALGEMSMTVAHEIKNPLNAIKGAVNYLQANFSGTVLQEFLKIIEEETNRLNEIVTSFLKFSKPLPLELKTSDINKIISDTVSLIRQDATENNIEVTVSLDEKITPFSFDERQIKQSLLNLLVNAIDATGPGDQIKISTKLSDTGVIITISDTGIGMSEEIITEIFKPFYTTKTRGSGLGLACVERVIRDHSGDISVKSEVGRGTEFQIFLPFRRDAV